MAPTLGKRKRITREQFEQPSRSPSPSPSLESDHSNRDDMQDIFRRAFEARFKPLDAEPKKQKITQEPESGKEELDGESDWSGISSEDDVEVVECTSARLAGDRASKAEMRAFMSSKPPFSTHQIHPQSTKPKKVEGDRDDPSETLHLKNDLALQRLLRDSHLLSSASVSASSGISTPALSLTGSQRHRSTDLHLLTLGAKSSVHTQKNMPMAHRKGIIAKAKQREDKRRAEARENGVILEKAVKVKKYMREREKGVGGPGVGRFRGGTLSLSKNDLRDITRGGGSGRGKEKEKRGRR
ncbi:uncharacterized protein BDR25DRAFT_280715 [Lindgomyces ingoldianus]|uniref:Uncharacterized protein n=1 Tax=Lindgomyces ingoldianus TaxID=673940 RepID=A0ACB6R4E8_9PLEO|nr:uncharacterized protein BDR25DRAFT_280715 [Lindgomyces ingoldianus]KAF2474026.1 hypothetical protein BDR25DRAFT_280715 [Lindgomyces ingoldianus]